VPGTVPAGCLLDVVLLGVHLKIPPFDIVLWKEPLKIWDSFVIFDTEWVVDALKPFFDAIPRLVWQFAKSELDRWAQEWYERHKKEGE